PRRRPSWCASRRRSRPSSRHAPRPRSIARASGAASWWRRSRPWRTSRPIRSSPSASTSGPSTTRCSDRASAIRGRSHGSRRRRWPSRAGRRRPGSTTPTSGASCAATTWTRPGARRLAAWADVLVESYTPRVMRRFGLAYADLRQLNPRLVMLSTCLQGQTGPHAEFPGFGQLVAALSGFYEIAGWADRAPAPPYGAYTDYVVPRLAATALL